METGYSPIEMSWTAVVSSVIARVRYDETAATLDVTFHTGKIYRYTGVPASVHAALMAAESKGQFFNAILLEVQRQELPLLARQRPLRSWERPWDVEP